MCVWKEVWALSPSNAVLLPVSMVTAARRLQNGIFNLLLCLWVFNSWSLMLFCKLSCGHGGCYLLWSSLTFWFPFALLGDWGHLNQGRWGRREAVCQMSISMALGMCPSAGLCKLSNFCLQAERRKRRWPPWTASWCRRTVGKVTKFYTISSFS